MEKIIGVVVAAAIIGTAYWIVKNKNSKIQVVNEESIDEKSISLAERNTFRMYSCKDPDALHDYLMNLKICDITGNYNNKYNEGNTLYCHYQTDEGLVVISVDDNTFEYAPLYTNGRIDTHIYHLDEPVDWEYILSLMYLLP